MMRRALVLIPLSFCLSSTVAATDRRNGTGTFTNNRRAVSLAGLRLRDLTGKARTPSESLTPGASRTIPRSRQSLAHDHTADTVTLLDSAGSVGDTSRTMIRWKERQNLRRERLRSHRHVTFNL